MYAQRLANDLYICRSKDLPNVWPMTYIYVGPSTYVYVCPTSGQGLMYMWAQHLAKNLCICGPNVWPRTYVYVGPTSGLGLMYM